MAPRPDAKKKKKVVKAKAEGSDAPAAKKGGRARKASGGEAKAQSLMALDPSEAIAAVERARAIGEHVDTRRAGPDMGSESEDFDGDEYGDMLRREAHLSLGTQQRLLAAAVPVDAVTAVARDVAVRSSTSACRARLFHGHNRNAVTAVCVFDHTVFYGDKAGVVTAVDTRTRQRKQLTPAHSGPVLCLAVSDVRGAPQTVGLERTTADTSIQSYLCSGGEDKVIRVWQTESLAFVGEHKQHRAPVTGMAFRLHSHQLVTVSLDKSVRLYAVAEMLHQDHFFGHTGAILAVAALGRERCATVGEDRVLRWWKTDQATQTEFKQVPRPLETVAMLDDQTIVVGGRDGSLALFDVMKRAPLWETARAHGHGHVGDGTGLEREMLRLRAEEEGASPTAAHLGGCDEDAVAVEGVSPFFANPISAMACVPFSDLVATGSCDGFVRLWRYTGFRVGAAQKLGEHQSAEQRGLTLVGAVPVHGYVNALCFDEAGAALFCALGKEPRLGRWTVQREALNGVHVVPLTHAGLDASRVPVATPTEERARARQAVQKKAEARKVALKAAADASAKRHKIEKEEDAAEIASLVARARAPVNPAGKRKGDAAGQEPKAAGKKKKVLKKK